MVILVEGNEGTGKSTLISELMEQTLCLCIKYNKDITLTVSQFKKLAESNDIIIFDRSFISDMVYRIFDERKPHTSLLDIAMIFDAFKYDMRIIWCENKNGFINALNRGENNIIEKEDYDVINKNYEVIMSLIHLFADIPIMRYDYKYNTTDDVIDFILNKNIERRK